MPRYRKPLRPDEIYHWGLSLGGKSEEHKYFQRITLGKNPDGTNKYRYFYSKAEYDAYSKGEEPNQNGINKVADKSTETNVAGLKETVAEAKKTVDTAKNFIEKAFDKIVDSAKEAINKGMEFIRDAYEKSGPQQEEPTDSKADKQVTRTVNDSFLESYKIDKHNVDPNADKYDSTYTDEQVIDNLKKTGVYDMLVEEYGAADSKELKDALVESGEMMSKDDSWSDFYSKCGLLDETQDGMHPKSFSDLNKLEHDVNDDVDMYCVNADNLNMNKDDGDVDTNGDGYPDKYYDYGYTNNCAYCTLAYDMRQRGYDVEASAAYQETANTVDVIESWYDGGKFSYVDSDVKKEILQHNEDGARGQFCVYWSAGGGHSMTYEVRDGEVYIRDCQINEEYKYDDWPLKDYVDETMYMRTDNLTVNENALVGVKNRTKKK